MTLVTGNGPGAGGQGRARGSISGSRMISGFTMIEVMVVVAILALLMSMVLGVALSQRKKASIQATRALIQRIEIALQDYHNLLHEYPPDGLDSEVHNADGTPILGSACLYHFLSSEVKYQEDRAGEIIKRKHDPLMEFKASEIREDPENPGVFEIVDGFDTPFHYDNTENRRFDPQDGSAHMPEVPDHPPDPRESVDYGVVTREGIQGTGYDLWSHGEALHRIEDAEKDLKAVIASWKLDLRDM